MLYPENIEQKIDFTVIREELLRRCSSPLGRERVDAMRMETDFEVVSRMLCLTDQMRMAQSDPMLTFPRGTMHDLRESIARIRIAGLFLDEAELDDLRKTLSFAADLEQFFASLDEARYPLLRELPNNQNNPGNLNTLKDMVREIDRILDRYGKLADHASPELAQIRRELTNAQGSVEGRRTRGCRRRADTARRTTGHPCPPRIQTQDRRYSP